MLIVAVAVYLLERLFFLTALFGTPLLLFSLAWLVSLILKPLVDWLTLLTLPVPFVSRRVTGGHVAPTWRLPRGLAVALVYAAIIALIAVLVISLVPIVEPQLVGIDETLPSAVNQISQWISGLEGELRRIGFRGDLNRIAQPEALAQQATTVGSTLIQQSLGIASGIASLLVNLFLVLILSYYITLDGPRIAARVLETLPQHWRADTLRFFTIVNQTFGGFLRAQLIQGLIYGLATALVMTALGLNFVASASIISAIIVLVPIVGGVLGVLPPFVIAILDRPGSVWLMLILLGVVQQVLFNMVMPRLMGRIVGLHPLLVFAAILVGATVAGGWGILFGIPLAGVIAAVLQFIYGRATVSTPEGVPGEVRDEQRMAAGKHPLV
ncbi:MAG TPA: AI-2E family transporter [Kouleothrix sp.]|nr:AI-2E family transporter [Kouleothrix sp.]